jgi:hypothetical protein
MLVKSITLTGGNTCGAYLGRIDMISYTNLLPRLILIKDELFFFQIPKNKEPNGPNDYPTDKYRYARQIRWAPFAPPFSGPLTLSRPFFELAYYCPEVALIARI